MAHSTQFALKYESHVKFSFGDVAVAAPSDGVGIVVGEGLLLYARIEVEDALGVLACSLLAESYPCRMTMGAMVRYKRMTGKDVGTIGGGDVSDLVTLLYCCVVSASKADGVSFDMDFETFADHLDAGAMTRFVELLQGDGDGEKKTAATE